MAIKEVLGKPDSSDPKTEAAQQIARQVAERLSKIGKKTTAKESPTDLLQKRGKTQPKEPDGKEAKAQWAKDVVYDSIALGERPPELVSTTQSVGELQATLKASQAKIPWLVTGADSPEFESTAQVLSEIAHSGLEGDANYLIAKGAQLREKVMRYDASQPEKAEARKFLNRIYKKADELKGIPEQAVADGTLTEKQRQIHEMIGNALTQEEAGRTQARVPGSDNSPANADLFTGELSPEHITNIQLKGIIERISAQQTILTPSELLNYARSELVDFKASTSDDRLLKSRIESRIEWYRESLRGPDIPTHISPTQKEFMNFFNDPIGEPDKHFQRAIAAMMQNPDNPQSQEEMERVKLIYGVMFSEDIQDEQILIWAKKMEMSSEEVKAKFDEFRKTYKGQLSEYADALNRRLDMAMLVKQKSIAADLNDKQLQGVVNGRLRESDFLGLGADMGGTVEIASKLGRAELEALLYDKDTGKIRMILPQELGTLQKTLTAKLREENTAALLSPLYKRYLDGEFFASPDVQNVLKNIRQEHLGIAPTYDEACESIATMAIIKMQAFFDNEKVLMRGLGPGSKDMLVGNEKYEAYQRKAKVLSVKEYVKYHIKIWENAGDTKSGTTRIFFRHMGENYYNAYEDNGKWARERTDDLYKAIENVKSMNVNTLTSDQRKERQRVLGEVKETFYFNDDPNHPCRHDTSSAQFEEFFNKLTQKKLLEEVKIDCGVQLAETHLARAYFFEESGWRTGMMFNAAETQYFDAMKMKIPNYETLSEEQLDELHWGIMTSPRFLKASIGYFNEKIQGDSAFKQANYINEAAKVALFRPHSVSAIMYERGSQKFSTWFAGAQNELGYAHAGAMFTDLSPKFELVNSMLQREALPPIDYSRGPDQFTAGDPRLAIIRQCFGGDEAGQRKYFTVMQKLDEFLLGKQENGVMTLVRPVGKVTPEGLDPGFMEGIFSPHHGELEEYRRFEDSNIFELTSPRYEPAVIHERWSDIPYGLLENSRLIEGYPEGLPRERLSDRFTSGGNEESDGGFKRTWRDLAHAETVKNNFKPFLSPSEEEVFKNIPLIAGEINGYMGPDAADICISQFVAARAGMEKVYDRYTPLFAFMKNSSDMRRHHPEAESKSIDELNHLFEKMEHTLGKFKYNAPKADAYLESVKTSIGVTKWKKWLGGEHGVLGRVLGKRNYESFKEWMNDNMPTGVRWQSALFAPVFIAGLVAIYTFGEAKKQTGQKEEH